MISRSELQQHWKQLQKLSEKRLNRHAVKEYQHTIEHLTGVHQTCDETVDWSRIHALPAPFTPPNSGPKQLYYQQKLDTFAPRWYERLFGALGEKRRRRLEAAVRRAAEEDTRDYEEWRKINELAGLVLRGDADAYFQAFEEMNPFGDLLIFGSDFECSTNGGNAIEVEYRIKSEGIIPDFELLLTPTGKLSRKQLSKTRFYELMKDFVCSCTIRVARDTMALLPVQQVAVHVVDHAVNTATGHLETITVLSVVFERERLNALNFAGIDPSDAIDNFPCHMNFSRTSGFKPVERMVI